MNSVCRSTWSVNVVAMSHYVGPVGLPDALRRSKASVFVAVFVARHLAIFQLRRSTAVPRVRPKPELADLAAPRRRAERGRRERRRDRRRAVHLDDLGGTDNQAIAGRSPLATDPTPSPVESGQEWRSRGGAGHGAGPRGWDTELGHGAGPRGGPGHGAGHNIEIAKDSPSLASPSQPKRAGIGNHEQPARWTGHRSHSAAGYQRWWTSGLTRSS